jgi:nitroimidazol reductase NimA-like FMN-containing flavoprotein (pyridoxamine 5'-phosphate oxidase superfamily)
MGAPHGSLDQRFSAPGATAIPWAQTLAAIEAAELFWVTTVRADGRPHMTPLVAIWLDGAIHFSTGPAEQKAVNLRSNDHVILSTGRNDWNTGFDVVIEGSAERVSDHATLERLAVAWRAKWGGSWRYEVRDGGFHHEAGGDDPAHVFRVVPAKVLVFGKDPFSHTRYRFG